MNGVLSRFTRLQRRLREGEQKVEHKIGAILSGARDVLSSLVARTLLSLCCLSFSLLPVSTFYSLSLYFCLYSLPHFAASTCSAFRRAVPVRKNFARERLVVMNWLLWIFQLYYFSLFFLLGSQCLVVRCLDAAIPSIRRHKITSNGCEHFRIS